MIARCRLSMTQRLPSGDCDRTETGSHLLCECDDDYDDGCVSYHVMIDDIVVYLRAPAVYRMSSEQDLLAAFVTVTGRSSMPCRAAAMRWAISWHPWPHCFGPSPVARRLVCLLRSNGGRSALHCQDNIMKAMRRWDSRTSSKMMRKDVRCRPRQGWEGAPIGAHGEFRPRVIGDLTAHLPPFFCQSSAWPAWWGISCVHHPLSLQSSYCTIFD